MSGAQQLIDRAAVADVVTQLGELLDGRHGEHAAIYDREVLVRSPRGEFRGLDEVVAHVSPARGNDERSQHFHTDVRVTLDVDQALVQANELVQFFHPGQPPHRTSGLRVEYRLMRRSDGWRIVQADIALEWLIGELPT